jgi:hypothetical protein
MKHYYRISIAFLAIILTIPSVQAQDHQEGLPLENLTMGYQNKIICTEFKVMNYIAPGCEFNEAFNYSIAFNFDAWGQPSSDNIINFPSLPGGHGPQTFTVRATYKIMANGTDPNGSYGVVRQNPIAWDMYVNGELCVDCFVGLVDVAGNMGCNTFLTQDVTFTHTAGSAYDNGGVQQISLRPRQIALAYQCYQCLEYDFWPFDDDCISWIPGGWVDYSTTTGGNPMENQAPEFRFNAVFVGVTFTEVVGQFDTPQVITCILRDPPGDKSYGEWTSTQSQCFGTSSFAGTGTNSSQWAEVQIGIGGDFLGFEYEVYASGGVSASIDNEMSTGYEYMTCIETTQSYTTSDDGAPEDLFIGSSVTYDYGMGRTIYWEDCVAYYKDAFAMRPVATSTEFALPESAILNIKIPELEEEIANLAPGGIAWTDRMNQLDVWQQAIDLNNEIKAEATGGTVKEFVSSNGAAAGEEWTTTTSQVKAIEMKVRLENGLSVEYGASIGGSGVSAGGEFNIRTEYGSTSTASNVWTNTMSYKLGDDDVVSTSQGLVDEFYVKVMPDPVFGSYVFELIEFNSYTSCPYEGGQQIEQPQLWVGSENQEEMTISGVPIGTNATFPVLVHNDSQRQVTYRLSVPVGGNEDGAVVTYNGVNLNNGTVPITLAAGATQTINVLLAQNTPGNLSFENVQLQLGSGCYANATANEIDDEIEPSIVELTAYFGTVGINDINGANGWFSVSPNPSNGIFRLMPKSNSGQMTITVTDLQGRTVLNPILASGAGNTEIDLSHVATGMYLLVAERDGERQSTRLMVEH